MEFQQIRGLEGRFSIPEDGESVRFGVQEGC